MARVTTLKDKVRAIIRAYKKVNGHRYLYNDKAELKARFTHIKVWFLIHDKERGYSIFPFTFRRTEALSVGDWTKLFREPVGKYQPLFPIFTQAVLPAINNKGGNAWVFKSLLCWTGIATFQEKQSAAGSRFAAPDAVSKSKNSNRSKRRNKTSRKGHANARSRNRGR